MSLEQVRVIKTLPHLIPLHTVELGVGALATSYSVQIVKFLQQIVEVDHNWELTKVVSLMESTGWERVNTITAKQEYSLKGDVLSLWPAGYTHPIKLEFDFDKLTKIYSYDETYGRQIRPVEQVLVSKHRLTDDSDIQALQIAETANLSQRPTIFTSSTLPPQLAEQEIEFTEYDFQYPQLFWSRLDLLKQEIHRLENLGYAIKIVSKHIDSLPAEILPQHTDHRLWNYVDTSLSAGFVSAREKVAVFTDREIFGTVYLTKRKQTDTNTSKLLAQFEGEISVGDHIVHEEYGVAIYAGLTQELVDGQMQEYLKLEYAGEDELLVPISQVDKLTKFIGNDGLEPKLSRLGHAEWRQAKNKVKKSVTILARDLISHYAQRELATAQEIEIEDSPEYARFVSRFPFTETEDQLRATNEILDDMHKQTPMNRLLVGDVGFGKTEVIMRAAFKAVEAGMQVAVLCPTTVLSSQHFSVFSERFKDFPIKIVNLSRFNSVKENRQNADMLNSGVAQIAVGTHALLRGDLKFKRLGLLVVDEEQKFGVAQKEKIKKINYGVHHLSVSATPIPRTLGMALSTIQEISLITQAPVGRKPIKTEVTKLDWQQVSGAIQLEVSRGGQVYFVHNRVQDIESILLKLQNLLPGIRITLAHGQMAPSRLDKEITDFYLHKYDVLLCTTIIENGLDMPNVNTMIIHQAERFGLSQLYQLRGRVGRSDRQAFCYLFYTGRKLEVEDENLALVPTKTGKQTVKKKFEPEYIKRLQAMAEATELGAGFNIASRDLEIRGAGNLLGAEQHGNIAGVGYALYMQMLAQEMEKLKSLAS
ncbi:DEAD/DEAH box helicase [Candidatus Dojkabacteria bacterium]|uniref:DEAD/DEAH box helicase n=1 Tax=Candidatus Dojkabacteria bacterium TaxID=2099670 RepID=A0A955KZN7_9BACT|nr:DEAD/DEAH box helicase [Candidatus Dojkabacteria bacterium]